jgi:hypothetical protein
MNIRVEKLGIHNEVLWGGSHRNNHISFEILGFSAVVMGDKEQCLRSVSELGCFIVGVEIS